MLDVKLVNAKKQELSDRSVLQSPESEASRRELVRRVVQSTGFARSERLTTLLTYVCDLTLRGRQGEINEQNIGQAVFGRSRDYDSSVDGIVRSQASRLRHRLEQYFESDGLNEPMRIVIPRGGYVPLFEPQSAAFPPAGIIEDLPSGANIPAAEHLSVKRAFRRSIRLLPWVMVALLSALMAGMWVRERQAAAPAVAAQAHPLWGRLFRRGQPVVIVAPDSGLVLYHVLSGQDVSLKQYLDASYRSEGSIPPRVTQSSSRKDLWMDLANRRYTSIVDLQAILSLKDRAYALGSNVSVRYARDLRPNDLKAGTTILLGATSADPWVELFERNMNFVLQDDYVTSYAVLNRHPQKGEPERWVEQRNDPLRHVYGLVGYLPNLTGDGNALLLAGISVAGTEAATDFVMHDNQLLPFLDRIRRPDGTLPHFEVLLATQNLGASAVRSQIVAWRIRN